MVDQDRLLTHFLELVRIDSLTYNEKKVVDYLTGKLADIGWQVMNDDAGDKIGGNTGNLIAHRPGDPAKPAIFFNCHLDTVEPGVGIEPEGVDGVISAKGETILGA